MRTLSPSSLSHTLSHPHNRISGADDVSNFDTVFTSEVAEVSPIEGSAVDSAGGNFNKFEE